MVFAPGPDFNQPVYRCEWCNRYTVDDSYFCSEECWNEATDFPVTVIGPNNARWRPDLYKKRKS